MIDAPLHQDSSPKSCPHPELCPLSKVCVGQAVRIKRLEAPPEISYRLREMGFCEEQQVRLIRSEAHLICQVCNMRLGISAQLAASIWVELLPAERRAA